MNKNYIIMLLVCVIVSQWTYYFYDSLHKDLDSIKEKPHLPAKNNDDTKLINDLQLELKKSRDEISSLRDDNTQLKKDINDSDTEMAERKAAVLKYLSSSDSIKRTKKIVIQRGKLALSDIVKQLNMSEDQEASFTQMYESKSIRDVEIIKSVDKYGSMEEKYNEIDQNLAQFRSEISEILDSDQIQKYEDFEHNKSVKFYHKVLNNYKRKKLATLPNLDEYQKSHIEEIYSRPRVPPDSYTIGVHGTYYESYKHRVILYEWYQKQLLDVKNSIRAVLDDEQLKIAEEEARK